MKKVRKRKYSLLHKIIFLLNCLVILMLLLSYLNPYVDPGRFPYLALLGLAYPVILLTNLMFVLLWLIRGKLTFLYSLVAVLLGLTHFLNHFQFHFRASHEIAKNEAITLLSYNVHLFGYFDWKHREETRDKIVSLLENSDADIYCFQEFFEKEKVFPVVDTLQTVLKTPYVDTNYFINYKKVNHFGLAIYSRFPIIHQGRIQIREGHSNYSIFADIVMNGDTVRIYNNHLESIRFSSKDYSFYEDLTHHTPDQKTMTEGSLKIFKKLLRAYKKRAAQVELLQQHLATSPYPVILCGDFNDTPLSYTYRKLSAGLTDAFVQSGLGFGTTYAGIFPSYRIDYILYSPRFRAVYYKTHHQKYSDHYPIVAQLVPDL